MAPLATMTSPSPIDGAIQMKISGKGIVRAGKGIILVISNEEMDDIIRIIKSLENSGVLTLISMGFLGVRFEVGVGCSKNTPHCLKLHCLIILETSNLPRKYTNICSFREYTL